PVEPGRRRAYFKRRKDDFEHAYAVCFRAQEQADRAEAARSRFESIRNRLDTLPSDQQARFQALDAQYAASGYNNAVLLQNVLVMDAMMHVLEPRTVFYENNTYYGPTGAPNGGWQTGASDNVGPGQESSGQDSFGGSDSGAGGDWDSGSSGGSDDSGSDDSGSSDSGSSDSGGDSGSGGDW